ncbi:MAG TPA: phage minor head protein [Planctomycetota bacterium]|nr:phage minor head protein [Planctomycetota bacterium]
MARPPKVDQRLLKALRGRPAEDVLMSRGIRHALYLERLKTHQVGRVLGFLNDRVLPDVLARIEARLARVEERGFDAGVHSTRRLRDLAVELRGVIAGGVTQASARLQKDLAPLAASEAQWQKALLEKTVPLQVEWALPSTRMLASIVTARPMSGRLMKDWFDDLARDTQGRVTQQLNIGLASGETLRQIVARIRGTRDAGFRDGVLQVTRREAEGVVRTAVGHVSNHAREATYEENGDVIEGVRWLATLDTSTCPTCAALDGQVTEPGEGQRPPAHWNCRCTTTPVLKTWRQLGVSMREASEGERAAMGGPVRDTMTYGEWIKEQPAWVQEEALGPARAKLLRDGDLEIGDFVDRRGRQLTLEQLEAIEA